VSVARLLTLVPEVGATGHGIPMHGEMLRTELAYLAVHFNAVARPRLGRYAHQSAVADASGVVSVPPPLVQPWVKALAVAGVLLGAAALAARAKKGKKQARRAWYHDRPARPRPYRP
jgi:hypothetical protein